MAIKIIGAGLAGLLAARLLRHYDPIVYEAQPQLPNNHSAVLRFRSSLVGDATGIPFRRVTVVKHVLPWTNPVADALAYSEKNGGQYSTDRSIRSGTEFGERFIAPPDFIKQLARGTEIVFGAPFDFEAEETKVISTIPMPALMLELDYPYKERVDFQHRRGVNVRARIEDCDAYVSLYVPDPTKLFSRISITGDELIVECPSASSTWSRTVLAQTNAVACEAARYVGITTDRLKDISSHEQSYQKILPIDERQRKDFIHWASVVKGKAFSLGRFATWRPGLLADDLIKDVRLIDSWIRDGYGMDLHHGRG
jgi:hypothetical protein